MKRKIAYLLAGLALIIILIIYLLFSPATSFTGRSKFVYVTSSKDARKQVLQQLDSERLVSRLNMFSLVSGWLNIWPHIKPGKFEIKKGESLFNIIRVFQKNRQEPSVFTINRLR